MAHELILIVDDNEQNRKLARDVLQFAGFRTLEAAGGVEGVALAVEHRPDLILMDIRMPDMKGTEAVRELREDERTSAIFADSDGATASRVSGRCGANWRKEQLVQSDEPDSWGQVPASRQSRFISLPIC